jgi:hypothetical protein
MHPATHRCEAACVCTVCNSDRHLKHACFIAQGVPKMVKLSADMMVELRRLHDLYKAGKFDWKSTTTTLKWMNAMRRMNATEPVMAATATSLGTGTSDDVQ